MLRRLPGSHAALRCAVHGASRRARVTTSAMTSVLWFRKGLRLHDNPALLDAAKHGTDAVLPVFCLDPHIIASGAVGARRMGFLLESLADLDGSLRARGSRLVVLHGNPGKLIPEAVATWGAAHLCYERDTEPYALTRDAAVAGAVREHGAQVHPHDSHTLWPVELLIAKNGGKAPRTMGALQKVAKRMPKVATAAAAPDSLPAVTAAHLDGVRAALQGGTGDVPSLEDLGIVPEEGPTPFKGGESEGLARLERVMAKPAWVCKFEKPKGNPAEFAPEPATTVLSPYMKFGCVSARLFYLRVLEAYETDKKGHTEPPVSLEGQLLWREFYYAAGYDTPNFHKMQGNPEIKQVPWKDDPALVRAWEEGRTGYPWIDAIMTQLRQWGWMHHLARHSVACFLTRGDLWCHWEAGRDVFDKYLIDGDHFINNGNWQWLSASNFFYQYFRVYSPVTFGQKYDKSGKFVRHFLPVLKDMPDKYVYEPWKAPLAVQRKAGCVVGEDYPAPIVDHAAASAENKARMKAAYDAQKAGKPLTRFEEIDGDGPHGGAEVAAKSKRKKPDS